jgi:hypothetical protein
MGILNSFLNPGRKDINAAYGESSAALQEGYDKGYGDYTTAAGGFDSYIESGAKSQTFRDDLLGLNGPEAQSRAYSTLSSNPLFTGQVAESSNALLRQRNATGGATSGGQLALAGARVLNQTGGEWIDRYTTGGQMGFQATGAKSNALIGRGDLSMGYGATRAGNAINRGNALAQSRNTGVNNLLGVAGLAVNALKPTPTFKMGA